MLSDVETVVSTGFVSLRRTRFFYSLWNVSPSSPARLHHVSGFSGKLVHAEVKGRRRKATKKCVAHDGSCFAWGPVAFCYNFRGVYRTTGAGIWWDGGIQRELGPVMDACLGSCLCSLWLLIRILYFGHVCLHKLNFLMVSMHADLHGWCFLGVLPW